MDFQNIEIIETDVFCKREVFEALEDDLRRIAWSDSAENISVAWGDLKEALDDGDFDSEVEDTIKEVIEKVTGNDITFCLN